MNKFLFQLIVSIFFFVVLRETEADTGTCSTPKLRPEDPLLVTIFDAYYQASQDKTNLWSNLCHVIKMFPKGLITMEYRPGAFATGTAENIKCGSGNCKADQLQGCQLFNFKKENDCYEDDFEDDQAGYFAAAITTFKCYCEQAANKLLLDNAALRASWKVPDSAIPALAFGGKYDSCAKWKSVDDIKTYLCNVYQNKVGPCSSKT